MRARQRVARVHLPQLRHGGRRQEVSYNVPSQHTVNCTELTQLHDAFIGHAHQRHDYTSY